MDAMGFDPETSDPNPGAVHVRKHGSAKKHGKDYGEKSEGKFDSKPRTHDMKTQVE